MPLNDEDKSLISEIVARSLEQKIAQLGLSQTTQGGGTAGQAGTSGTATTATREEEIMGGEVIRQRTIGESNLMFSNNKAAFDRHLRYIASLEEDSRNRLSQEYTYINELRQDARTALAEVETLRQLGLKGAVTSDALITKQAIAHRDVAVDSTWVPGPGEGGETEKTGGQA
jgi:hypothetical protein